MYYQYQSLSLLLNITIQAHLSTTLYIQHSIFSDMEEEPT